MITSGQEPLDGTPQIYKEGADQKHCRNCQKKVRIPKAQETKQLALISADVKHFKLLKKK
jgi:hypothetical protein